MTVICWCVFQWSLTFCEKMCKYRYFMLQNFYFPPFFPVTGAPCEKTYPLSRRKFCKKWYFPKGFFKAVLCSRGMWKMVRPRWLAVNVPFRRKFPSQRFGGLCTVCSCINHRLIYLWWMFWGLNGDGCILAVAEMEIVKYLPFSKRSCQV